jgi:hypothetical protein
MFLQRGSTAVALAGVAASMPLLCEVAQEPPLARSRTFGLGGVVASWLPEGLVAHVRDVGTGETNLDIGGRHIMLNDPGLARALLQVTC